MRATRETHTTECVPHTNDLELGVLKTVRSSVLGPQKFSDTFTINQSVETSVNKNNLPLCESVHNVRAEATIQANINDQTDFKQSKKHAKQDTDGAQGRKQRKNKVIRKTKEERFVSNDYLVTTQYELGRKLGDGNFANVYQSRKTGTGREFAIKVIGKSKLKGKEYMVEDEIRIMKDCRHHNIIRLYEEFETPCWIYLVMELVKGGDLFDAISQSVKFAEVDSALMIKDLCHALFYLHSRRIVHRDIKPENLLVHRNKDGSVTLKLADFGLAMEVKGLIYAVCGTPTYVAPEILSETGYGLEIDMWAVGIITYILLCGFPPFRSTEKNTNQSQLFESIKAGHFEFLSPFWDHVSAAIDVLTHVWIVSNGQTSKVPNQCLFVDNLDLHLHHRLEETAELNYQTYQILKEKRRREKN
ncbi:unnamed protein product [Candidula unifasciata]|uniref:Protein kinase domain-containing protein n=1 Tax=Candidula unifasciata TaxID=100452 RepID=A0A8S3Z0N0_9EUPU|nr:unnamed protein product [Candidula unifasciata]